MTVLAVRQWERALGGLLAVPSALAVSTAAGALIVTSVVERTFAVFEESAIGIGRRLGARDVDTNGDPRAATQAS
jgi:hypothetical protein